MSIDFDAALAAALGEQRATDQARVDRINRKREQIAGALFRHWAQILTGSALTTVTPTDYHPDESSKDEDGISTRYRLHIDGQRTAAIVQYEGATPRFLLSVQCPRCEYWAWTSGKMTVEIIDRDRDIYQISSTTRGNLLRWLGGIGYPTAICPACRGEEPSEAERGDDDDDG